MGDLVTLRTFQDPSEAIVARALLEQHGLLAVTPEIHQYSVHPWQISALGGLRLMVRIEDLDAARALLDTAAAPAEAGTYETCPKCESANVVRFAHWTRAAYFLSGIIPPPQDAECRRCSDCGHKWQARPAPSFYQTVFLVFVLVALVLLLIRAQLF